MQKHPDYINYQIDTLNQEAYFIQITIFFETVSENPILAIPAWRPGRYMLQNYSANIRDWKAADQDKNSLPVEKKSRNEWEVTAKEGTLIQFSYLYFCRQMDAGGCWNDPSLFYINPIACLMMVADQGEKPCKTAFKLPEIFRIATGMSYNVSENLYEVSDFSALSDSPVLATPNLYTLSYSIQNIPFYMHSNADASYFPESLASDFSTFTQSQIDDFGSFPEKEYHFLLLLLPYTHYHGVEHRNSTVICLGPTADIKEKLYTELLGICSHELLHSWNICKIRPVEMLPYILSKENYFKTGFVAEGFTTYLGDYYLAKSGVLSSGWYESEWNTLLKRHFYSFGNHHLSIADSSFDLWVDGYDAGIPNRKVSIYVKGAIIAFLMDVCIRKSSTNKENILSILKDLWLFYSNTSKGYSESDIEELFHFYTKNEYKLAYTNWIYGTGDLKEALLDAFLYLGYDVTEESHSNFFAAHFGILCDSHYTIQSVDPASPYRTKIGKGDKILSINAHPVAEFTVPEITSHISLTIELSNGSRKWEEGLTASDDRYFKALQIKIPKDGVNLLLR